MRLETTSFLYASVHRCMLSNGAPAKLTKALMGVASDEIDPRRKSS